MIGNDTAQTNAPSGDDKYRGKDHALPSAKGASYTNLAPISEATEESPLADEHAGRGYGERPIFHGLALARDVWLERYGAWLVIGFTGCLVLFLLGMTAI